MTINWEKVISWLTALFVFGLTAVSIILTYNALYDVAYDNGLTGTAFGFNQAYLWPLTIDGALIVFSMAVVNASLSDDSPRARWVMVGVFTFLTIIFNFVDGGTDRLPGFIGQSLPFVVRVVPPLALVLSFETLMSMLRKSVKRGTLTKSIRRLSEQLSQAEGEHDKQMSAIQREADNATRKRDKLLSEVAELTVIKEDNTMTEKEKRLAELPELVSGGFTAIQIADRFGVKERTVYRYLEETGLSLSDNGTSAVPVEVG